MTRWGRLGRDGAATFVVLGLLGLLTSKMNQPAETVQSDKFSVIDGDSLSGGGERLRLLGIDAPEYRQQCQREGVAWPCGRAARDALALLLPNGHAECRGRQRDRYGRLLVTCRVDGLDVNAEMVRRGMAVSFGDYQTEEAEARTARAGLWVGSFERPQDFRRDGGMPTRGADPLAGVGNYLRGLVGWP